MNKDIITLYDDNNQKKDYKLLLIINKDFKYLIYTDIDNDDYKKNIYAIKTEGINRSEEVLPIDNNEWKIIEDTYSILINA